MWKELLNQVQSNQSCLIVNDDPRTYQDCCTIIVSDWLSKNSNYVISYWPMDNYIRLGYTANWIWTQLLTTINTKTNQSKLVLVTGLGQMKHWPKNFQFNPNTKLIMVANGFVNYQQHNTWLNLVPKYNYLANVVDQNVLPKSDCYSLNHYYYQWLAHYYQTDQLTQLNQHWTVIVEQLISEQISYLNHKRISSCILRNLIQAIALAQGGKLMIGQFCQQYQLRYESVMLALDYLIKTNFIYEIKLVLNNQTYSQKKQSLYFFQHNFIYYYYQLLFNLKPPITPIIISQCLNEYWAKNQNSFPNLTYQTNPDHDQNIIIKIDWHYLKVDLSQPLHQQVIIDESLLKILVNQTIISFNNQLISLEQFLKPIKWSKRSKANQINFDQYLTRLKF